MINKSNFEQYEPLFRKADLFWSLATENLKDEEYEKLVGVYVDTDAISWNNLSSDVFTSLKKSPKTEVNETFMCIHCSDAFNSKDALNVHIESHVKQELLKCATCPFQFLTEKELKEHEIVHLEVKPYKCDVCNKTFKMKSQLRIHKDFSHADDKPLRCNFCARNFKQFDALQKHRLMHQE